MYFFRSLEADIKQFDNTILTGHNDFVHLDKFIQDNKCIFMAVFV